MRTFQEVRTEIAHLTHELESAERDLLLERLKIEQQYIDNAGGEKNIGSNEAARTRTLTLLVESDATYQRMTDHAATYRLHLLTAKAELETILFAERQRENSLTEQQIVLGLAS